LVPIKNETSLNASLLITERKLITKCWNKNTNKKKPERAIRTFLPIEDFENP